MTPELVERVLAGDRRALARVLSQVENGTEEGLEALRRLSAQAGRAQLVGVTGGAGCGKSTLVTALAKEFRRRGRSVGIVAVDPTSPFTQGALLGDRIRMQELTRDPGVFVRSMATRGALGGLAPTTLEVATVLDASGFDVVLIETVGAGQDEVEVAAAAETTVVLSTPGTGDGVQAMKAGVLEVADILVVNKADLPSAEHLATYLQALLEMGPPRGWQVPVLRTVATTGEGVEELVSALDQHRQYLVESGRLEEERLAHAKHQILGILREDLVRRVLRRAGGDRRLDQLASRVVARELDARSAARELIQELDRAATND